MGNATGIVDIPFKCESPEMSPMDYSHAFGLLKQVAYKRHPKTEWTLEDCGQLVKQYQP